jgi:phosphohistidine swiveling domain-containing protein
MAINMMMTAARANPQEALLLPLGSGKAASLGVGNKARLLDIAAREGLRVPTGYILLDRVWELALAEGYLRIQDGRVVCDNPAAFYESMRLPAFPDKTKVAVRSAFTVEDTPNLSMAGHFASIIDVDPSKPKAFIDALCKVWDTSLEYDDLRRDVLVMVMVDAQVAGVAFTEAHYEDDRVNFVEGTAEKLLAGEVGGDGLELPRLRPFEKGENEEGTLRSFATWQDRLQAMLRRVRRVFGAKSWDIEWADDGVNCYLLQVRPVTAVTQRDEVFTLANHKEILPPLPSRYMVSVIEACAPQLYEWYRQFDSSLPTNRPFIEVFKGRPYINLSLLTETMRALGLPTNLVTDNIGGDAGEQSGLNVGRALSKLPTLAQLGSSQLNAAKSAEATAAEIAQCGRAPGKTFTELNNSLVWIYTALVREMFNLTQAMSLPLVMLRRSDKLEAMAQATRTISTKMYDDLLPLRELVQSDEAMLAAVKAGQMPSDPEFKRQFGLYLVKYGHRGVYESDIARPRYSDDPSMLLAALAADSVIPTPYTKSDDDLGPVAKQAQRNIVAREQLRHDAMRAFANVRATMLELAEAAVAAGQIPSVEVIWNMTADELALLDAGWQPEAAFFEERSAEIEALAAYNMPDTLRRFDDLEAYNADVDPNATRLSGMGLVTGTVTGQAWVLQEPSVSLPEGYDPKTTVLVARSVDAGWIPTFAMVAGVVVETGGDLSHGSIVLRELRLPSVTNVAHATQVFSDGDTVVLDGGNGSVKKQ